MQDRHEINELFEMYDLHTAFESMYVTGSMSFAAITGIIAQL
jgi:hypothetical protein